MPRSTDELQAPQELVDRSRRIGADASLVLFGGGNTSAKGVFTDHLGREQRVLWVKQSGIDLRTSTADDFSALRLEELTALAGLPDLSDADMSRYVTASLLEREVGRPSIETLLHAFLPALHVDHVHADSICALTNHSEGERVAREALGDGFAYVDWMRPGHRLSKIVGNLRDFEGVVLAHHGLITWADNSDACLERTLATVRAADAYIDAHRIAPGPVRSHDDIPDDELSTLLLHLRGAMGVTGRRILRVDTRLREVADRADLEQVVAAGVASADHMLTIKPRSCALQTWDPEDAANRVAAYADEYLEYVRRNADVTPEGQDPHDPMPRVVLVPGFGGVTTGVDRVEAAMVADIALHTTRVAATVQDAFGSASPLSDVDTASFEYWPLEVYKLTLKPAPLSMSGHITVVTGAGSGIGRGIAVALGRLGASIVMADLDRGGMGETAEGILSAGGPAPISVVGDQSDPSVVRETVDRAVREFGGLDGVVLNAGIAVTGPLEELDLDRWDAALRINLTSAFLLTQESMRALRQQGLGGSLVYIASKNAFSPGAGFGAYSVSKAGMLQLMRVAALEGGQFGIRANAINPDAVFDNSRLWESGIREERAAAHGIRPDQLEDFYAARNIMRRHVGTADVAAATRFLLSEESSCTTGAVLAVDGGVAAAFPR